MRVSFKGLDGKKEVSKHGQVWLKAQPFATTTFFGHRGFGWETFENWEQRRAYLMLRPPQLRRICWVVGRWLMQSGWSLSCKMDAMNALLGCLGSGQLKLREQQNLRRMLQSSRCSFSFQFHVFLAPLFFLPGKGSGFAGYAQERCAL